MKIASTRIYAYQLPLRRALTVKDRTIDTRQGLLIRMETDTGAHGWGDAAPLPGFSRESLEEARAEAVCLANSLPGIEILPPAPGRPWAFAQWAQAQRLSPSVRFGLETAALNALAVGQANGWAGWFSEAPGSMVRLNGLVAGPPEGQCEAARALREAGFTTIKLKVGRAPVEEEIERVRAVRKAVGDEVRLRLDANRAWDWDTVVRFGRAVERCGIETIEEPLRDPAGMDAFAKTTGLPVALDETLLECGAAGLPAWKGAAAVVLKPTLLGGIAAALDIAWRAKELGMAAIVSGCFESGVGLAALAELGGAMGPEDRAMGLQTYDWLAEDLLAEPLDLTGGRIDLDQARRAALSVDTARLQEVTDAGS